MDCNVKTEDVQSLYSARVGTWPLKCNPHSSEHTTLLNNAWKRSSDACSSSTSFFDVLLAMSAKEMRDIGSRRICSFAARSIAYKTCRKGCRRTQTVFVFLHTLVELSGEILYTGATLFAYVPQWAYFSAVATIYTATRCEARTLV